MLPRRTALASAFAANAGGGRSQGQGSIPRSFYIAMLVFVLALIGLYHYGVPWMARVPAAGVPVSVTKPLDDATLAVLDGGSFNPSALPDTRQQALKASSHPSTIERLDYLRSRDRQP